MRFTTLKEVLKYIPFYYIVDYKNFQEKFTIRKDMKIVIDLKINP